WGWSRPRRAGPRRRRCVPAGGRGSRRGGLARRRGWPRGAPRMPRRAAPGPGSGSSVVDLSAAGTIELEHRPGLLAQHVARDPEPPLLEIPVRLGEDRAFLELET